MSEETSSKFQTVKAKAKVQGRRPKTGVKVELGTKYADDPLGGLSAYQKALLTALREKGMLNIKEATALFVEMKAQQGKNVGASYESMTTAQQKVERNTCRKTFEKLARRDLVDILDVPNVGERLNRNREPIQAVVGKIKAYKLAPGATKLVAGL